MIKKISKSHISPHQVAFIPSGRWIVENTLIAQEIASIIFKKTRGKCGLMRIKLDMRKAYDMVEFNFSMKILHYKGFSKKVCNLIY